MPGEQYQGFASVKKPNRSVCPVLANRGGEVMAREIAMSHTRREIPADIRENVFEPFTFVAEAA